MTRRTYHYDEASKTMVEGPAPSRTAGSGDGWRFSDRLYSGAPFVAPDGSVIDSKKKHRDYMKRNNLTTVDDFKGTWDKAAERRADVFTGKHDRLERARAIAKALGK